MFDYLCRIGTKVYESRSTNSWINQPY